MPEEQFKRNIAFKLRIGDILMGKPYVENEKFTFLELGNKKIVRVNIIGNIVDKYESNGERKFLFITIDDGSGQIKLKTFGDDCSKFTDLMQGETVVVIGTLRYFNNEVYIAPEIVKEQDPRYLLIRKLEVEKTQNASPVKVSKEQIIAVKDRILENIKNSEDLGGVNIEQLIMKLNDISPEIINQEIRKFIEEGIVFEPRPGKVRYLG